LTSEAIIIELGRYERNYWRGLWHYRELFRVPAWHDLAVRCKQTVIGVAWAVIRPLLTMLVCTIIFGRIAKLPSERNAPYPLIGFCRDAAVDVFCHGLE
jgi:lipopolysaccharide transport system permease protein